MKQDLISLPKTHTRLWGSEEDILGISCVYLVKPQHPMKGDNMIN